MWNDIPRLVVTCKRQTKREMRVKGKNYLILPKCDLIRTAWVCTVYTYTPMPTLQPIISLIVEWEWNDNNDDDDDDDNNDTKPQPLYLVMVRAHTHPI